MSLLPGRVFVSPLLLALVGVGCERASKATETASTATALRERTATRFASADFLKPLMDGSAKLDPYLAPLIYLESPHDAPLGVPRVDADGELTVDGSRPTVYYADRLVELEGRERRQITYVWFRETRAPRAQGVRLTFDHDGFPVITEVLDDESGHRILYVTRGLEDEAETSFGRPLPGRTFAIENAPDGEADVVLAGSISGAPAPMGPYVYQARDAYDITTVHCRCSPTQADDIREMIEYELLPLGMLAGVWPAEGQPDFAPPGFPARRLRLPPSF